MVDIFAFNELPKLVVRFIFSFKVWGLSWRLGIFQYFSKQK